jgi:concentrative nucleoside transporter, CNT family
MKYLIGIGGIALILAIAYLCSSNRRWIRPRVVVAAFALQAAIAVIVLYTPWGIAAIKAMSDGVVALLSYANQGTRFLIGDALFESPLGQNFAFGALPVIIFFAALISILYYLGIMQFIIKWIGGAIRVVTGITRVESLGSAANIFVGQSESPLVIRPYLASLTPSQLFCVMTVGMAGVAGTILGLYANTIGHHLLPYLLAASFMSAPGGILMAKIIMPDDPQTAAVEPEPVGEGEHGEGRPANIIMAASEGAMTGVKLAVAVGAMVLAFVGLLALINGILGGIGGQFGRPDLSIQMILGQIFQPLMFMLNVPWNEAGQAGGLFGTKIALNELVAFFELKDIQAGAAPLSAGTIAVVTFMLCGFANFSSIAIQMAVTGGLAPNQRPMIARLGLKALLAASLSNLMSAALAGFILAASAAPPATPAPAAAAPAPVAAPAPAPAPPPAAAPANAAAPAPAPK